MTAPIASAPRETRNWWRNLISSLTEDPQRLTLVALGYFAALRLATLSHDMAGILAAVWPPGGVALAALLLSPRRQRGAILITVFITGISSSVVFSHRQLLPTVAFMLVDVLESWSCAWLIERLCGKKPVTFARVIEVLALTACALVVNGLTAFLGSTLAKVMAMAPFSAFYQTWWISNGLGILLVTPLVVVCAQPWRWLPAMRFVEAAVLGLITGGLAWLVFDGVGAQLPITPEPYWICVLLVWVALRFGPRGTMLLLTTTAVMAIGFTEVGQSTFPLGGSEAIGRLHMVQLFLGIITLTGLVLAAEVSERAFSENVTRQQIDKHRYILETAMDGFWTADAQGRIVEVNETYCRMVGYSMPELLGMRIADLECCESAEEVLNRFRAIRAGGQQRFETQHRRKDGSVLDLQVSVQYRDMDGGRSVAFLHDITHRKRAEEEIRRLTREQQIIIENANIGISLVRDRRQIWINDKALDMFGYPRAELEGQTTRKLYPSQEAYDKLGREAYPALAEGRVFETVQELVRRDGTHIWVKYNGKVIDPEDLAIGTLWLLEDITEHLRTERALRDSEEKFRQMAENISAVFWITSPDFKTMHYVSPAYEQIWGHSAASLYADPKQWEEAILQQDKDRVVADLAGLFADKPTVSVEYRIRRPDGDIRWIHDRGFQVRDDTGRLIRLTGIATDITERKHDEAALIASENKFHAIAELSPDIISIFDCEGRILFNSAAAVKIHGYKAGALENKPTLDFIHPDDRSAVAEELSRLLKGSAENSRVKYRYLNADGSYRWMEAFACNEIANPQINGILAVSRDITERIEQQEKVQRLLIQSEQDAQTKSELLREVNHRVTNNLTAVLGLMGFEAEHQSGPKVPAVEPMLERLRQRIRDMLNIHQMLAHSGWTPVSLEKLAAQTIQTNLRATGRNIAARLTIKPSAITVSPRQAGTLAMVLSELVTNSVKYAGNRSGALTVNFEAESDEKWIIMLYRDNGPGYSPEVLANERHNVGLKLIRTLVGHTLRGTVELANDDGAVATLRIQREEVTRT